MAAVRCYENRPPQSGFGDDFDAVGDDNSFHFALNFWLVAGRRGFACRDLALLNVLAMIKAQFPQTWSGDGKDR